MLFSYGASQATNVTESSLVATLSLASWIRIKIRIRMELQFHPDPTRKLSTILYDIYHC